MTCHFCKANAKKSGKFKTSPPRTKVQRYRCLSCGKMFKAEGPLGDMRISEEKAHSVTPVVVHPGLLFSWGASFR